MTLTDTLSFARAHDRYLQPPDDPDSRVQLEGCLEFSDIFDLESVNLGDLDEVSIIDAGFDPETDTLKIWVSGWLDCDPDGEWDRDKTGDLLSPEVIDCENISYGPDPDEEWDNRDLWGEES